MREGQVQKVPYPSCYRYERERGRNRCYRLHGQKETTVLPLDEFVEKLTTEIETKSKIGFC